MLGLTRDEEKELLDRVAMGMLLLSIPVFLVLYFVIDSPWGKHVPSKKSEKWFLGPLVNAKMSWIVFESPNLLWCLYCYLHRDEALVDPWNANSILLCLFFGHYVNRSIIFPLRLSPNSKPIPLLVVLSALAFTGTNGYLQAQDLCQYQRFPSGYHSRPRFVAGVAIFLTGLAINLHSDSILRNLRKSGETGYQIPRGGFFELCSGAHHMGEIAEWAGFAIACGSIAALSFWAFTCANLVPRAVSHHRWYLNNFKDYPRDRKAVVPFMW